jgi:hypothetical protein
VQNWSKGVKLVLLKGKWLSKQMKPYSLVDDTLIQQGFKKNGKIERPFYELLIQDSSTECSYKLIIPTVITDHSDYGRRFVQMGTPYLRQNTRQHRYHIHSPIPETIINAAECKLTEVKDYLLTEKNQR